MWRCEEDAKKMWRRCEDEKMWRRCEEDVKMRRCEDEQMWRCEDEKMWWQTSTIRRTLRSDVLGKKWIDMNDLTWRNWNEWLDMNELKLMNWQEWIAKVLRSPQFCTVLCEMELSLQSRAHFADLIFKKWSQVFGFCDFLCETELSLQSRAHFVDLIFKKWSEVFSFFFYFLCEAELSLQSRAHFFNLIFQKWSKTVSFLRFLIEIKLSLQSRAHFVDHFPDRAAHPRKQRPSSGDRVRPLYAEKKHRVSRPRGFSAVNSRVPARSHFSTTSWWCGWHDDVVGMMIEMVMSLPWWWES